MPRLTLRDTEVHYQQTGDGPDVVLIHGLSSHIACWWFHVAPRLAETHRVTAIDLRGHGFSGMTDTGYRPCDLAADIAALMERLGIETAHVVGHSFGGAVAAAVATEYPGRVSELTLVDAWLPSLQPVPSPPNEREWAATVARARHRGMVVDPNLPLVMQGLLVEMLDESDLDAESAGSPETATDAAGWAEPDGEPSGTRRMLRGMRLGAFGERSGRGARLVGRLRRFSRQRWQPAAAADAAPEASPLNLPKEALSMTGGRGRASLAVMRWHKLMRRTHALTEFSDTTALDPPALRDIAAPVRLVYGARSKYRPTAEALQDLLPEARLHVVPRAGHFFHLLRPSALLDALETPPRHADTDSKAPGASHLRLVSSRDPAPAGPETDEDDGPSLPSSGVPRV